MDASRAKNDSIFSLARIFLPEEDKKRKPYNLKGYTIARLFARILGLDKDSPDGKMLLEYKNPERASATGDLGKTVYSVLMARCSRTGKSPSIAELHSVLDQLARSPESEVNLEGQRKILQGFIPKLSPLEGKWLVRILLKNLGIGLSRNKIFACIHPQAQELYARTISLEEVCLQLNDPNARLEERRVELFQPFKFMKCSRLNSLEPSPKAKSSGIEAVTLPAPPFLLETKFDGERLQIHYDSSRPPNNRFMYVSSLYNEFTSNFSRTLTPVLEQCIKASCKSFILDGEMMVWNKSSGSFIQKGAYIEVKNLQPEDPVYQPAFVVFDVVYLNGESLLKLPLKSRMEILKKHKLVLEPVEGSLYLSEHKIVQSAEEVVEALNEAVDHLEEGLIVKDLQSTYELGKRQNAWLKIKPEFLSEYSIADLDLLILGGYYHDSVRKMGSVGHFLVGLLDNDEEGKEVFYPVTRLGPGHLRQAEMEKLVQDLEPHFVRSYDPRFRILLEGHKLPDFYIDPKKSIVVQVKAMEFLYNKNLALKYTLRFPRLICVRRDKTWQDVLTLKEFHQIRVSYRGKFAKRSDDAGSVQKIPYQPQPKEHTPPKRKVAIERSPSHPIFKTKKVLTERHETVDRPAMPSSHHPPSSKYFTISKSYETIPAKFASHRPAKATMKLQSNVFDSHVFCIIGSSDWKQSVEEQIVANGGEIVQNPTSDMFAIIAEIRSYKVDKLIKKNQYDVLKSSWISKCLASGNIEKILPEDAFGVKPETLAELAKDFDIFGDSYRTKNSYAETNALLKRIMEEDDDSGLDESHEDVSGSISSLHDLDPKDMEKIRKFNFLNDCKIAFRGQIHPQDVFMYKHYILFYGGKFAQDETEPGVTHVVAWDEDSPSKKKHSSAFVVKPKWFLDCLESRRLLEELNYMIE